MRTQIEPGNLPELEKHNLELEEPRQLQFETVEREENCRENSGDLQRDSLKSLAEN